MDVKFSNISVSKIMLHPLYFQLVGIEGFKLDIREEIYIFKRPVIVTKIDGKFVCVGNFKTLLHIRQQNGSATSRLEKISYIDVIEISAENIETHVINDLLEGSYKDSFINENTLPKLFDNLEEHKHVYDKFLTQLGETRKSFINNHIAFSYNAINNKKQNKRIYRKILSKQKIFIKDKDDCFQQATASIVTLNGKEIVEVNFDNESTAPFLIENESVNICGNRFNILFTDNYDFLDNDEYLTQAFIIKDDEEKLKSIQISYKNQKSSCTDHNIDDFKFKDKDVPLEFSDNKVIFEVMSNKNTSVKRKFLLLPDWVDYE